MDALQAVLMMMGVGAICFILGAMVFGPDPEGRKGSYYDKN